MSDSSFNMVEVCMAHSEREWWPEVGIIKWKPLSSTVKQGQGGSV